MSESPEGGKTEKRPLKPPEWLAIHSKLPPSLFSPFVYFHTYLYYFPSLCHLSLANQTKRIAEVSGSGRKVRAQKGGGVARAGHSRPPHWRGGAKAHGPRMRDFSFKLNKKFIKLGLRVRCSGILVHVFPRRITCAMHESFFCVRL